MSSIVDKTISFVMRWKILHEEDVGVVGKASCKIFIVKAKRGLGVVIKYSSPGNTQYCPFFNYEVDQLSKKLNLTMTRFAEIQEEDKRDNTPPK